VLPSSLRSASLPWLVLAFALPGALSSAVLLTVDEALEQAFPGCEVERETVYLTEEQREAVERVAGSDLSTAIVHPYRARCEDPSAGGVAYFDAHRVRTLQETLMIVVDPEHRVRRVEVRSFLEPQDYIPRAAWYGQFVGEELDEKLDLDREIQPVTGATLTAVATTAAVRRVLAIHRILEGGKGKP